MEGKSSETGFMGFVGLGKCQSAIKSRIGADYTDDADFGDFCLPSVFVRRAEVWILRSEDANWKVCGTNRPTEEVIRGYKPLLQGDVVIPLRVVCKYYRNIQSY